MDQRISRRTLLQGAGAGAFALGLAAHPSLAQGSPVASPVVGGPPLSPWNESSVRTSLLEFVTTTTTEGSPD